MIERQRELKTARELARQASSLIMAARDGELQVEMKSGNEPVTIADRNASDLITAGLRAAFPDDVVISEENPDNVARQTAHRVWYIDPIDGTKDFIGKRDGFSVMIGLCIVGEPVLGVVAQPSVDRMFYASVGGGSWCEHQGSTTRLAVSQIRDAAQARLVASQNHRSAAIDEVKQALGINDELNIGSIGVKLCLIALGVRDLYVNVEPKAKLWDTCAPAAILAEAGGKLTDLSGATLDYRQLAIGHETGLIASNGLLHDDVVVKLAAMDRAMRKRRDRS